MKKLIYDKEIVCPIYKPQTADINGMCRSRCIHCIEHEGKSFYCNYEEILKEEVDSK